MQIILASAKIMNEQAVVPKGIAASVPRFLQEAQMLARDMMQYPVEALAEMLGCSRAIASQNRLRYLRFEDPHEPLPTILAYHGQAYKHLKAETLDVDTLQHAQRHLWVMSFLYGLLRPLDNIRPYRLEGHVELAGAGGNTMFDYWKPLLTQVLIDSIKADDGVLIHLATEEFQRLVDWKRVKEEVRVVQPMFLVRKGDTLKVQAVWAKTCRGAMTRMILQERLTKPEELAAFQYEGFTYSPASSEVDQPCFIKET